MRLYIHIQLQHHFRGKIGHFFNIVSERTLYSERIPVFIWSCPVLFFEFYQIFHEAAWRRGGGPQYLSKSFFFFSFLLFSKAFGNFSSPALAVYWSARAHAEAQSEGSAAVCNTRQSSLNLSKWSSGRGRPGKMVQKGLVYVFRLCVCVCVRGVAASGPPWTHPCCPVWMWSWAAAADFKPKWIYWLVLFRSLLSVQWNIKTTISKCWGLSSSSSMLLKSLLRFQEGEAWVRESNTRALINWPLRL